MLKNRYSVIIANRATGTTHRLTCKVGPVIVTFCTLVALPLGFLAFTEWNTSQTISELRLQNARLELENSSYRTAAQEVSSKMQSLNSAMTKLSDRVDIDQEILHSMSQLPASTKINTPHTSAETEDQIASMGQIQSLLGSLDNRLTLIRRGVAYREALAEATPVIWPADGWISATYGYRTDPFTGARAFHPAVDISTRKGQPVYATATGRVFSARRNGAYGNLVELDHGFGLTTRYGHLAEFAVSVGDTVQRGDVIGYAGATGRATGYHVHYEVWSNGQTVNPMSLLAETSLPAAN